jgi:hypothetical protein
VRAHLPGLVAGGLELVDLRAGRGDAEEVDVDAVAGRLGADVEPAGLEVLGLVDADGACRPWMSRIGARMS